MRTKYLAKFFVDILLKGQDLPVIIREVHEDGCDYHVGDINIQDGKVNIWFNRDYPIKK